MAWEKELLAKAAAVEMQRLKRNLAQVVLETTLLTLQPLAGLEEAANFPMADPVETP
jgi:hypothetical protein